MPPRSTVHVRRWPVGTRATIALSAVLVVVAWVVLAAPAIAATAPPPDTINDFLPEQRNIGDCLGALQRPGCGSEARGGWRQGLIFLALLGGLAVVAARIVIAGRRGSGAETS